MRTSAPTKYALHVGPGLALAAHEGENPMSKQKKWTLAVVLLLLAAVGGTLAWWYLPGPW